MGTWNERGAVSLAANTPQHKLTFHIQPTTVRSVIVPFGLMLLALIVLNIGLYQWLGTQSTATVAYQMPYFNEFPDESTTEGFVYLAGDWEVRDETLVQISPNGFDLIATIPFAIPAEQPYEHEVTMRFLTENRGGGLLFNVQQVASRQRSHMVRFDNTDGRLRLFWGYFDNESNFFGQGDAEIGELPPLEETIILTVQVNRDTFNLLVDGTVVATEVPLEYRGGNVGLTTSNTQVAFDNMRVMEWAPGDTSPVVAAPVDNTAPVAPESEPVSTTALPALDGDILMRDNFSSAADGEPVWSTMSGQWQFINGAFVQQQTDAFDLSAAYLPRTFSDYIYRVVLEHAEGQGGGVLFNLPSTDSIAGGQMVRFAHDADILMWGRFNENGDFIGEGSSEVPTPSTAPQTLVIHSRTDTYDIVLNDRLIVENIPQSRSEGYVGLTASQSVVRFLEVDVLGTSTQEVIDAGDGVELRVISGDWASVDGVTVQRDTAETDFIAGVGVYAERFSASIGVQLPDTEDFNNAGGGIIFRMSERNDPAQGYMVRFNGPDEIMWGRYDADGVFEGQGSTAVTPDAAREFQELTITEQNNSYAIAVNGETLIENIPLEDGGGWIGLISFRGDVAFSPLQLSLDVE